MYCLKKYFFPEKENEKILKREERLTVFRLLQHDYNIY